MSYEFSTCIILPWMESNMTNIMKCSECYTNIEFMIVYNQIAANTECNCSNESDSY